MDGSPRLVGLVDDGQEGHHQRQANQGLLAHVHLLRRT